VARLLREPATGDGDHCTRWSKMYAGRGWARASQSGKASTGGSSHAGDPRVGLIRVDAFDKVLVELRRSME